jgi:hypothetical protein
MHTLANQSGPSAATERAAIIEEFWASRNAWADFTNAERRAAWDRKRAGILEQDLPPGHTYRVECTTDPRVLPLRRRKDDLLQEAEPGASVPGHRSYWQPKSLQIPLP